MPDHIRGYKRIVKIPPRRSMAAFDLETDGLGGRVLAASVCLEGERPEYIHGISSYHIICALVNRIEQNHDYVWYAHNAQYDWRYLFDEFDRREFKYELLMRTDNDVFGIEVETQDENKITFRDSLAFWPRTLRELLASYAPHLPKGDIDFERVTFNPEDPDHIAYALRDSEGLVCALVALDQMLVDQYGVRMGATAAGTAVKAWRKTIPKGVQYFNDEKFEDFIRSAYFGGLVFLATTCPIENAETYDINSSYPAVMRDRGVPYGQPSRRLSIHPSEPGIYRAIVRAPENLIVPILPARVEKGSIKQVRWPAGEFETTVTNLEINFALAHGYELIEVLEGISWKETIFPFSEFVDMSEGIRKAFKEKPEETLAKLIQNALYGKFGARRERRKIFRAYTAEETDGALPWSVDGRFWVKKETAEDMLCLPQWAVFITANARLNLLATIYDVVGVENVIYGDTDSITIKSGSGRGVPCSKRYGDWKLEKTWNEFRAIAPKVYAGRIGNKWKGAIKGIPKKKMQEKYWRVIHDTGEITRTMMILPKFVQHLKGNTQNKTMSRASTNIVNSVNWEPLPDGSIRPRKISNVRTEAPKLRLVKNG